jgi:hypothetical protein
VPLLRRHRRARGAVARRAGLDRGATPGARLAGSAQVSPRARGLGCVRGRELASPDVVSLARASAAFAGDPTEVGEPARRAPAELRDGSDLA